MKSMNIILLEPSGPGLHFLCFQTLVISLVSLKYMINISPHRKARQTLLFYLAYAQVGATVCTGAMFDLT